MATATATASAFVARLPTAHSCCNVPRPNIVAMSVKFKASQTDLLSNAGKQSLKRDNVDSSLIVVNDESTEGIASTSGSSSFNLMSVSPLPLLALATLPGASSVASLFQPIADVLKTVDLPGWLIHWGHPGNMAVVLFAMGGYGSYLGWQIRLSDDRDVKAQAKDLHPKLLGGMFFFFSLGATGGILSLLMSGKPIFESPHAVTGFLGLAALAGQTALTGFFESNPSLRGVHGIFGSGIMLLFIIHAIFGLQLGLSF